MPFVRTTFFRAALAVILLATIPLFVLQYTLVPKTGAPLGFTTEGSDWTARVNSIEPHSQAQTGGIRVGDILTVPLDQRVAYEFPLAGDHIRFLIRRGTHTRTVTLTEPPAKIRFDTAAAIRLAVNLCLAVFALLVLVRGWSTEHGWLIAAMLATLVFDAASDFLPFAARSGMAAILFGAVRWLSLMSGPGGDVLVIMLLARLLGRRSRALQSLLALGLLAVFLCGTFMFIWDMPAPSLWLPVTSWPYWLAFSFAWQLILPAALVYAMVAVRGEHRAKLGWIFWGFFPFECGVLLTNLNNLWFVPATLFSDPTFNTAARLLELSLPVSLFYGLLVRRTVDIGFVINRVAVFGLISALVLGVFVLLEYLAGHFVETRGAESWAIQLGIAMTIGVSARFLHGWVDRFVDRVFFAKRHADESALQRFAQEAEAFTSADVLLDTALSTVTKHSDTLGAAIYLCGDGTAALTRGANPFPETIDADDPLLVAMRRWNEPVDTHDAATAFPDGMVFPMSARGRLIGALACRTKRDATAFAPDEREPLADVARAVARALDTLGARPDAVSGAIVPILLSLQSAVAGLQQSVQTIQQTLGAADAEVSA